MENWGRACAKCREARRFEKIASRGILSFGRQLRFLAQPRGRPRGAAGRNCIGKLERPLREQRWERRWAQGGRRIPWQLESKEGHFSKHFGAFLRNCDGKLGTRLRQETGRFLS